MYDDDEQWQALGQPSLDILNLKKMVQRLKNVRTCFSIVFFSFPFVQYVVYIHVLSDHANIIWSLLLKTSQCLGQSLPLEPLYRFFYLFFLSFKKEIKSAGTEKCDSCLGASFIAWPSVSLQLQLITATHKRPSLSKNKVIPLKKSPVSLMSDTEHKHACMGVLL